MANKKRGRSSSPPKSVTTRAQKRAQTPLTPFTPAVSSDQATNNSPIDARFGGLLVRDTHRLHLGIDFGTSSCAAFYAVIPKDTIDPRKISPSKLELHQGGPILPARIALLPLAGTDDAVLVFGNDIDTVTKPGEVSWNDVWLDIKQSSFLSSIAEIPLEKRQGIAKLHGTHKRILQGATKYRDIFLNHEWLSEKMSVELKTTGHLVEMLLRYFLMEIKSAIRNISLFTKEDIDALFSARRGDKFGDRVRVGVAIPEVWTWQRMTIHQHLRDAGFHEDLELLSEGRCALAKGLKDVLEEVSRSGGDQAKLLPDLKRRVYLGIDDGGYTLDGAIMELVQEDSFIKMKVTGQGHSSQNGSNRANDIFKDKLPDVFGRNKFSAILKQHAVSKNEFVLNFERGFEEAKCSMSSMIPGRMQIVYSGPHKLTADSSEHATWVNYGLKLDKNMFLKYLKDAVDEKFAVAGPIQTLWNQATAIALRRPIHVIFSGGGSKSKLLQDQAKQYFARVDGGELFMSFDRTGSASCVAEGACIMLADPDLSRRVHEDKKSYGIVITVEYDDNNAIHRSRMAEKKPVEPHFHQKKTGIQAELPDTIVWKTKMNDPLRFQMEDRVMHQTIWTDNDGRDKPDEGTTEWGFELHIAETSDAAVGTQDGYSVKHHSIDKCGTLRIKIDKELAEVIGRRPRGSKWLHGFHQGEGGLWRLDFDYVLSYQWRGMLQYFEVKIPEHGAVRGRNIGAYQGFRVFKFLEKAEWKSKDDKWEAIHDAEE